MLSDGADEVKRQLTQNKVKPKTVDVVNHLSALEKGAYLDLKKQYAKRLGITIKDLDTLVNEAKGTTTHNEIAKPYEVATKPYEEAVSGCEIAFKIKQYLNQYLALPKGCDIAITLWIIASYTFDTFPIFPRLLLTSPEKGCGKTTTLSLIQALVNQPLPSSGISGAAVYRSIEQWQPTLLIDEADTFLSASSDNHELIGVINSGHNKTGAYILRCVGDKHEIKNFSTWAPMVIAMIKLPTATLIDRSIVIELQKKRPEQKLSHMPMDINQHCQVLRAKVMRFTQDNQQLITEFTREDVPNHSNARTGDNWLPLFAVAQALGDEWLEMAVRAFDAISTPKTADDDIALVRHPFCKFH